MDFSDLLECGDGLRDHWPENRKGTAVTLGEDTCRHILNQVTKPTSHSLSCVHITGTHRMWWEEHNDLCVLHPQIHILVGSWEKHQTNPNWETVYSTSDWYSSAAPKSREMSKEGWPIMDGGDSGDWKTECDERCWLRYWIRGRAIVGKLMKPEWNLKFNIVPIWILRFDKYSLVRWAVYIRGSWMTVEVVVLCGNSLYWFGNSS